MNVIHCVGSYGRDYPSGKAVQADWDANKDFTLQPEGRQINKQDVKPGTTLNIRFKNQTQVKVIKA